MEYVLWAFIGLDCLRLALLNRGPAASLCLLHMYHPLIFPFSSFYFLGELSLSSPIVCAMWANKRASSIDEEEELRRAHLRIE